MGIDVAKARKQVGRSAGRAREQTEGAVSEGTAKVEREARGVAVRGALREAPYAGIGLGRVIAGAVRDVDAPSLPARLRRTPGAVAAALTRQGPNAQVRYLALAARGRGEQLHTAGEEAAGSATARTKAAATRARDAASRTWSRRSRAK